MEPGSPVLEADCLPAKPPGKPISKETEISGQKYLGSWSWEGTGKEAENQYQVSGKRTRGVRNLDKDVQWRTCCAHLCTHAHASMSDSETPRTVAHLAPQSMGFPRQGYWSGLSFPTPGDIPDPGFKVSLVSPALAGGSFTTQPPGKLGLFIPT